MTDTRGVAFCIAPRKTAHGKEIVKEAELLDAAEEHIHKSSVGRPDSLHWLNHGPDINRDGLDHAIPGCALLREGSQIQQTPEARVCFGRPSCGRTKRGRAAEANPPLTEIEEADQPQADGHVNPPRRRRGDRGAVNADAPSCTDTPCPSRSFRD